MNGCVSVNDLWVVSGYEDMLAKAGLDSLDALCRAEGGDSLTKPGLANWRERIRLRFDDRRCDVAYLKRYRDPPRSAGAAARRAIMSDSPAGGVRISLAGLEWHWMHALAREGICCVRPIAFGEEFRGGREQRSAVLAASVPGQSLEFLLNSPGRAELLPMRELVGSTAELVARFHAAGYIHRDLYLAHIFFDGDAAIDQSLHLIDLQRVFRPGLRRERWLVKDLASLNYSAPAGLVSRADRLRWLKSYLGAKRLDGAARRLFYRVVGKTASIARHDLRRRRRLQPGATSP